MSTKTPEQEIREAASELVRKTDEVKTIAETAQKEIKNLGDVTAETKKNADKALLEMNTLAGRITELEQKSARRSAEPVERKSIGQFVTDADELKAALKEGDRFKGRVTVEVKNITSGSTSGTSATTGLVVADRQAGIVQVNPNRKLVVRDLVSPGRTSSSAIDYVRETVFTNAAAMVAENPANPKPQSDLTFDMKNVPVRTLAHFVIASKQIMADAPMLQSYIDGRLRYGLEFVEDTQLLLGDGTGVNILGLIPQATAYAAPTGAVVTASSNIDVLRMAMLQATLALFPATGHVLHDTDWTNIELIKDTLGRYIFANPQGVATPTMWGLPVVTSLAMTQGSFLTGAFKYAAQIFDREDATVTISTEDRDNFVKNMVTILAEERLALCVYRPQAIIKGTFAAPA